METSLVYIDRKTFDKFDFEVYEFIQTSSYMNSDIVRVKIPDDFKHKLTTYVPFTYKTNKKINEHYCSLLSKFLEHRLKKKDIRNNIFHTDDGLVMISFYERDIPLFVEEDDVVNLYNELDEFDENAFHSNIENDFLHNELHRSLDIKKHTHKHSQHEFTFLNKNDNYLKDVIKHLSKIFNVNISHNEHSIIDHTLKLQKVGSIVDKIYLEENKSLELLEEEFHKAILNSDVAKKYITTRYFERENIKKVMKGLMPYFPYPSFIHLVKNTKHSKFSSHIDNIFTHINDGEHTHSRIKTFFAYEEISREENLPTNNKISLLKSIHDTTHFECPNIDIYEKITKRNFNVNYLTFTDEEEACLSYYTLYKNKIRCVLWFEDDTYYIGYEMFNKKLKNADIRDITQNFVDCVNFEDILNLTLFQILHTYRYNNILYPPNSLEQYIFKDVNGRVLPINFYENYNTLSFSYFDKNIYDRTSLDIKDVEIEMRGPSLFIDNVHVANLEIDALFLDRYYKAIRKMWKKGYFLNIFGLTYYLNTGDIIKKTIISPPWFSKNIDIEFIEQI